MSIVASELVAYASANMPDVDTGTNGGAIDTTRRIDFVQIAANDTIQAVSTSASDTQNLTITARNAAGAIVTETKAMTGTTAITFSTMGTVERVLQAELASAAIGTITVRRTTGPVTLRTIAVGERGFMALFRKTASDPSVQKDYYTKIFLKNTNATLSLLSALVKQSADPDSAHHAHAGGRRQRLGHDDGPPDGPGRHVRRHRQGCPGHGPRGWRRDRGLVPLAPADRRHRPPQHVRRSALWSDCLGR
jgi:hypothetical protein